MTAVKRKQGCSLGTLRSAGASRRASLSAPTDRRRNRRDGVVKGRATQAILQAATARSMNEARTTATSEPDARAAALLAHYERAGYRRAAPAILQPAEPFLDLSGEDLRNRIYL